MGAKTKSVSSLTLVRSEVPRHHRRRLPYYFTTEEAHQPITVAENQRDNLFLRLLWKSGVRVSEAISLVLGTLVVRVYPSWARGQ